MLTNEHLFMMEPEKGKFHFNRKAELRNLEGVTESSDPANPELVLHF